jgi:hypothetical protein
MDQFETLTIFHFGSQLACAIISGEVGIEGNQFADLRPVLQNPARMATTTKRGVDVRMAGGQVQGFHRLAKKYGDMTDGTSR